NKVLKFDADSFDDDQWLDEIITYCRKAGLSIPAGGDSAEILQKAIEKGFPRGNHLIITTDLVDKRRILYKTIKQNGVIVDCSVPKGDRRADKMAQEAALNEKKGEILDRYKKTIDQDAYLAMYEMTGFDLRTCTQNLEKLISYVGDRKEITLDDVEAVIERTKKDPIYELTNAVAERSIERTLFFISSLLSADLHPLQILAAIINQVRKLMLVKGFVESAHGGNWHGGMDYGRFKNTIMPAIQNYDQALLDQMETWENMLADGSDADPAGSDKKNARKKIRAGTDLLVAKTPQNPYPVFLLLQNSAKYTMQELMAAMECLKQADLRLKSTRQRPKLILEEAIMKICSGPRRS
ncbi:MAG: hypothetical protein KKH68_09305, partial [Proteobacteria bacterium]|nr:hypothetical protein [Pseudomonadota bacterium]